MYKNTPLELLYWHPIINYGDVIMGAIAYQITSITIVYSTVYSDADQRKHQSSASLAFGTSEFPAQMVRNAENVSIWWRHHVKALQSMQWPGAAIESWQNVLKIFIWSLKYLCSFRFITVKVDTGRIMFRRRISTCIAYHMCGIITHSYHNLTSGVITCTYPWYNENYESIYFYR